MRCRWCAALGSNHIVNPNDSAISFLSFLLCLHVLPSLSPRDGARKREERNRARRQQEMENLRDKLSFYDMTPKERTWMSLREKNKGNECFRAGENEDALLYYSRAIALDDSSAVVFANRAMANIRLNNFDAAVSDCTMSIAIDPSYTKALTRRGMVHHRCGRYALAEDDFGACLRKDPTNKEFAALLKRSKEKRREAEGEATHQKTKKKVMIEEVSDSDEEEEEEEEEEEVILEMGADGFDVSSVPSKPLDVEPTPNFISSSKFKGSKPGMVFRRGDNGLGYYNDKNSKKSKKKSKADVSKEPVSPRKATKPTFKKIAIVEESDDDSSEDEEEILLVKSPATINDESLRFKNEGNEAMSQGNFEKAVNAYSESLKIDPKNMASLNNRALANLKLKRGGEALKDASACIALSSEPNLKALYRRGLAGVMLGEKSDLLKAKADFEKVLEHEPDNASIKKELTACEGKLELLSLCEDSVDGSPEKSNGTSNSDSSSPTSFTNLTVEEVKEAQQARPSPTSSGSASKVNEFSNRKDGAKKIAIEEDDSDSDEEKRDVDDDDDEDEEEEEEEEQEEEKGATSSSSSANGNNVGKSGTKKIAIEEDDSDSEEEATSSVNGNNVGKNGTKKIAIEEDDSSDSDEEETDEEKSNKLKDEGNNLLKKGAHAEAIQKYDSAIELWPKNVAAVNNKCLALIKTEKFEEGIETADLVLCIEKDNVKAIFRKACCIVGRGEASGVEGMKEALRLFERSKSLGGGGGPNCKERIACNELVKRMEESLKRNELRNMSSKEGLHGASPAKSPSRSVITNRVESVMKKLNDGGGESKVSPMNTMFDLPKTTSEMETAIRTLNADRTGEGIVKFLRKFKAGTYKKCFKDSMDPDLLSNIFKALDKTWNADNAERNKKIINQIAKVAGALGMVLMTMKDDGRESIKRILKQVDGDQVTVAFWEKNFKEAL